MFFLSQQMTQSAFNSDDGGSARVATNNAVTMDTDDGKLQSLHQNSNNQTAQPNTGPFCNFEQNICFGAYLDLLRQHEIGILVEMIQIEVNKTGHNMLTVDPKDPDEMAIETRRIPSDFVDELISWMRNKISTRRPNLDRVRQAWMEDVNGPVQQLQRHLAQQQQRAHQLQQQLNQLQSQNQNAANEYAVEYIAVYYSLYICHRLFGHTCELCTHLL